MNDQSVDLYEWLMRSLLMLGLICSLEVYTYILADEQEEHSVDVQLPVSESVETSPQKSVKELKIQGALTALRDDWPEVQSRAFTELDNLNALDRIPPEQIPLLALLLKHPSDDVRLTALKILGKLGEPAVEFLPQIAALLLHKEPGTREAAIMAISRLGKGLGEIYVPQLTMLLDDSESSVRIAAVRALGKLDPDGESYRFMVQESLKSGDATARVEGVMMLENLGETAEAYIPEIGGLLSDPEPDVRRAAVKALGNLGIPDQQAIAEIARLLEDSQWQIRVAAAHSLCQMFPLQQEYMPQILALLSDEEVSVRTGVLAALGRLGQDLLPDISKILELDQDPNPDVRAAVLDVLSVLGDKAEPYSDFIVERLRDEHWEVRAAAVRAFGNIRSTTESVLPLLNPLFDDTDWYVRSSAIKVLGTLAQPEDIEREFMLSFLEDQEGSVRAAAVWILGNWERHALAYLPQLLDLLHDPHAGVRQATIRAIRNFGQVPVDVLLVLIESISGDTAQTAELRFLVYSVGADGNIAEVLLQWLGSPVMPMDINTLSYDQAKEALKVFAIAEGIGGNAPNVLSNIAELSSKIITRMKIHWTSVDIALLESHAAYLQSIDSDSFQNVQQVVWGLKIQWLLNSSLVWGVALCMLHPLAWLGLCLLYPHYRWVRIIFFWNPYARWGLGLGYVHFALIKIPFLRNRFFGPYRRALLTDANLTAFDDIMYMKDVTVWDEQEQYALSIHDAIPAIHGQILLEGASGLGKSMFVRYLLKYCTKPVVYLPAEKCTEGVVEAILPKLQGECRDARFLRALVCEGALDLCIDGLDAISTRNQVKVTHFLTKSCRGNVLVATQSTERMAWETYAIYCMRPLRQDQIEGFLRLCYRLLPEDVPMSRAEYVLVCDAYLQQVLDTTMSEEETTLRDQVLTNPMNLTLVALLCAYRKSPDMKHLAEQCYQLIAMAYQRQHEKQSFPLTQFSERIYRMRLNDEGIIPYQRFEKEIDCMVKYALILSRTSFDIYGTPVIEWYFRHETIADFFILQAFLEGNSHRIDRHLGDFRFKGVYALLDAAGIVDTKELQTLSYSVHPTESSVYPVSRTT